MNDFLATETGIRQLHARYADAVWRKDGAAFCGCFTAQAEWRIAGRVLTGTDEIAAMIDAVFQRAECVQMTFQTPILTSDGPAAASARTCVTERARWKDGTGSFLIGRYFERFVQVNGEWRFGWRLFQTLYTGPEDLSGRFFDEPDFGPPPGMPPLDTPAPPSRRPGAAMCDR